MMKIKNENSVIIIPNTLKKAIVINRNNKINFAECLDSYINKNRKTNCIIFDEDGKPLDTTRIVYTSIPLDFPLENNMGLKQKTLLNYEITNLIKENEKSFTSLEKVRESLKDLIEDDGVYKTLKILTKGIEKCNISIELTDFDISYLLQFYSIHSNITDEELYLLFVYNLLLYLNRDNFVILHIRRKCGEKTLEWINNIQNDNVMILIDSDAIVSHVVAIDTLIIGSDDYLEKVSLPKHELLKIPYLFNPYILNNIHLQNEENIELINIFYNNNSSFLVESLA